MLLRMSETVVTHSRTANSPRFAFAPVALQLPIYSHVQSAYTCCMSHFCARASVPQLHVAAYDRICRHNIYSHVQRAYTCCMSHFCARVSVRSTMSLRMSETVVTQSRAANGPRFALAPVALQLPIYSHVQCTYTCCMSHFCARVSVRQHHVAAYERTGRHTIPRSEQPPLRPCACRSAVAYIFACAKRLRMLYESFLRQRLSPAAPCCCV
jgi:hypothetical protein